MYLNELKMGTMIRRIRRFRTHTNTSLHVSHIIGSGYETDDCLFELNVLPFALYFDIYLFINTVSTTAVRIDTDTDSGREMVEKRANIFCCCHMQRTHEVNATWLTDKL